MNSEQDYVFIWLSRTGMFIYFKRKVIAEKKTKHRLEFFGIYFIIFPNIKKEKI